MSEIHHMPEKELHVHPGHVKMKVKNKYKW